MPPSNNCSPRPSCHFSSFYPFPVKLKCNVIQPNWSVMIQALKINQGTKFETLKRPMFSLLLFDVIIFWLNGKINNIFRAQLPVSNIWNNCLPWIITFPRIIAPFLCKEIITPGYYSRKYGTWCLCWNHAITRITFVACSLVFFHLFGFFSSLKNIAEIFSVVYGIVSFTVIIVLLWSDIN